ncbi:phosphatidylinositol transfer protein 3-like isoform X1 [Lolium rigidum]|uniref:phosphatidylinositol transfer protein 3-like isoform X1 n=1 Tax=Lolium rigidum TaxID=89674 RepID=UPI001F5C354A|nr:phosphatidylinositol transfer protein 3-like isoform X1 [Lolium rigidum]
MERGGDEQEKQTGHGCCDGAGDASEWKKVAELRAVVEAKDPAAKEEDDFMLRRFLRARDHNIGKASAMFLKYLAWKRTAKPNGSITADEVRNELAQDKLYVQGHDKLGRPMVYLFGARHIAAKRDLNEFKRYVVYILDTTCTKLQAGQEKFASVVDLKGFGYANYDIRAMLEALDIMQNNYPERLGRVFLIHVPYVFMAAWKMVYPFIDDITKKKFVFVADKNLDATLRDAIEESQLPEEFGGKLKLQGFNAPCN